jgi:AcrR family transcriptional regulator
LDGRPSPRTAEGDRAGSAAAGPAVRRVSVEGGLRSSGREGGGSREAILDAAGQLLVTRGLVALTLDAVARRADVEASLISRWWPSEEALALDALRQEWLALAVQIRRRAVRIDL